MLNYKLITKNRPVVLDYKLEIQDNLDELKEFVRDNKIISIDTENSGLDPHTGMEYCMQVGSGAIQYVIDMLSFNYGDIAFIFESEDKIILGQGLKYDLQWLYKHDIIVKCKIWDTMLASQRLNNGDEKLTHNLQALEKRYLKTELINKSDRKSIHTILSDGYTKPVMDYSAADIYVLPGIYEKQLEQASQADMMRQIELECEFVKVLAYLEYCGIKVNSSKLQELALRFNIQAAKAKDYIVKLILKTNNSKYLDPQMSLFDDEPTVLVNFDDTNAMKDILKDIGGLEHADYSASSENSDMGFLLRSETKSSKIVNAYSEYLSNKRKSTLCKSLIKAVNPKTHRIHTSFFQINATGRLSCGDKTHNHPNIMGIDKDELIRSCIISEPGNMFANYDYDNMEYYIYAELSDNITIKQELVNNYDGHSEVARILFDKELKHLASDSIRARYPRHIDAAKTIRFTILNGGDARAIAWNFGCSSTQAGKVYDKYAEAFQIDNKLAAKLTVRAIFDGYLSTDGKFGGKYYLTDAKKHADNANKYRLLNDKFWEKYRHEKDMDTEWYQELKPIVSGFASFKKKIRTKSLNYLIQGIGSNIFKISSIYFFNRLINEGQFKKVLMTNMINDEHLIEGGSDKIDYWGKILQDCMIKAGEVYFEELTLNASGKISDVWEH